MTAKAKRRGGGSSRRETDVRRRIGRFRPAIFSALIVLAAPVAYANSFDGEFVFDSRPHILEKDWSKTAASGFRLAPRLTVAWSLALNERLGGKEVGGYRLFNVCVHALTAVGLFLLVRTTLHFMRSPTAESRLRNDFLALAVALLWVVHPLATQGVTYVIQRAESMMALCFVWMLCGAAFSRAASTRTVQWLWLVFAAAMFLLGLLSKTVMVAAFPVVLLYDRIFLSSSVKELVRRRGVFYASLVAALVLASTWVIPQVTAGGARAGVGFAQQRVTVSQYVMAQPGVILWYLRLVFVPYPLCLDYGWKPPAGWLRAAPTAVALIALLGLSVWALFTRPQAGFLAISFFLVLAPTSSIVPINDLAVEHRMYLPLAAVAALAVFAGDWALRRLIPSRTTRDCLGIALVAGVTCLFLLLTRDRNEDYRSAIAIWTRVTQTAPDNLRGWHNLESALMRAGRRQDSLAAARRLLSLAQAKGGPVALAHIEVGEAAARVQHWTEAETNFRKTVELLEAERSPTAEQVEALAVAHIGLGTVFEFQNQWSDAERQYRRAAEVRPDFAVPWAMLGKAYAEQGEFEEAVAAWTRTLELEPDWPEVHLDLARAHSQLGDEQVAYEHLLAASRLRARRQHR